MILCSVWDALCFLHHVLLLYGGGEEGEDDGQDDQLQSGGATKPAGGTYDAEGEANCENLEENVQHIMAREQIFIR